MRSIGSSAALILSGGRSRRFGADKMSLLFGGETLEARMAAAAREVFSQVIALGNAPGRLNMDGVREISDIYPGAGPLGGIHAGLSASGCEVCFVMAADMPLFDLDLAARLIAASEGHAAFLPAHCAGTEPLFAVYTAGLAPLAKSLIQSGNLSVRAFAKAARCGVMQVDESTARSAFYNINRPGDLDELLRMGYDIKLKNN